MKRLMLVIGLTLILVIAASYQNNSNVSLIISNLIYRGCALAPGNLEYQVNFLNVIPVGKAVLYKKQNEQTASSQEYHLMAQAKTVYLASKFFPASALLDSYIDIHDLNPVLFVQKIKLPGKEELKKEVHYDQLRHVMSIAGVERSILADTQDPLSALYRLENYDFDKNDKIEISINTNQKNYILEGKVTSKEISLDKKIYKLYILNADIRRRDKNPYHRTKLMVVFVKDKENIPLLIKVFSNGLLVNFKLVNIEVK